MRAIIAVLVVALSTAATQPASARNVPHFLKLQEVLDSPAFADEVGTSIAFAFGDQQMPVAMKYQEYVANARQHFKGRSEEGACRDTFIAAMADLKKHAEREGADAVVGIMSYFRRKTFSSTTEFECHAGSSGVFVSLKGTLANRAN
jgi:uncharacterized protein YbjQ (UPF0145 family)